MLLFFTGSKRIPAVPEPTAEVRDQLSALLNRQTSEALQQGSGAYQQMSAGFHRVSGIG